jgi:hypothetical protein
MSRDGASRGLSVPCPSKILAGGTPPPKVSSCRIELIGAAGVGGCPHSWRGWVVGSMQTSQHHLVLQASPEPVRSLSRMISGPGWYPGASEIRLGIVHAGGWTMRAVYADPATNDGSIFSDHLVLVWTTGGHLRTRVPLRSLAPQDSDAQRDRGPLRVIGAALARLRFWRSSLSCSVPRTANTGRIHQGKVHGSKPPTRISSMWRAARRTRP